MSPKSAFQNLNLFNLFVKQNFANHVILVIHVPGGNGEVGDFAKKDHGIADITERVHQATMRIKEITEEENWKEPTILYIVTDTPPIINMFHLELIKIMLVANFPQERKPEGDGIFLVRQVQSNQLIFNV